MNYEEYAARARKLNPIDDDFMRKMAEDMGFCQDNQSPNVLYLNIMKML